MTHSSHHRDSDYSNGRSAIADPGHANNGSNGGSSGSTSGLTENGRDGDHPRQLSLLPEYTEAENTAARNDHHEANDNGQSGHEDQDSSATGSRKWLTILGIILLIAAGIWAWRWWQGRSESQSQQPQQRATPVEIAAVETATVEETSTFTGTLEAEQSSSVQAEQSGRVAQILVEQGQSVSAGTPLVRLSAEQEEADVEAALARIDIAQAAQDRAASELEALRAERDRIQAEVTLQEEQYRRTETLVQEGALAREELDLKQRDLSVERANLNALDRRIRAAQDQIRETRATLRERRANLERIRENLQDTTITAPFAGVIGDIPIETGDYVQSGQDLTQLVANDNLDLNISIPQERASELERGLPVEVVDSEGNPLQSGRISFISPQVEADSQFIPTEATFANLNNQLRDGQFVRSQVIWESRPNQVIVPQSAVIYQGEERFVYVPQDQEGQMVAVRQPVELGLEQGTNVEIMSGLEPGQRIIVAGIQRLGDGVPIQTTSSQENNRSGTASPENSSN